MSGVQFQLESLGVVPNSGLLLPAVSPDGKWIAYLQVAGHRRIGVAALFDGKGLEAVSLHVRPVAPGAAARVVCGSGAAWPAWSRDSKRLIFVAYSDTGRCDLGVYEVATGSVRRISTGLRGVMMPAISPSGEEAAVVECPLASAQLHVLNLATGKLTPCPPGSSRALRLWPQWTADGRIVYVLSQDGASSLAQWKPGGFPPERLWPLRMSPSQIGVLQIFAGLGRPLSGDDRRLAYYDTTSERIVLMGLRDGRPTKLRAGTRFGCWLGSSRFVAAGDDEMLLFTGSPEPVRLLRDRCLPLGGNGPAGEVVFCTPGVHRGALRLSRLKVLSVK